MMPIEAGDGLMQSQNHDDPHSSHLLLSQSDLSHEKMMQSSDHTDSQGITCDIFCSVPASLLPNNDNLPAATQLTDFWTMSEPYEYIFNLHTLLFKPPRA